MDVATLARPSAESTLRGRALRYRLVRAGRRAAPTGFQGMIEAYRRQVDRVRWAAWRKVGIS
jgi:hypothetical protein